MMKKSTLLALMLTVLVAPFTKAQDIVKYDIKYTSIWNATDHTSVPSNAHWSKLVGATHKTTDAFFAMGKTVSPGIKNVAETGNATVFSTEVNTAISNKEADQYIDGSNLATATGDILIADLSVKKDYPLVSLITMVAPSPDWVIALNSYSLLDNQGNWKSSEKIDLFVYDAGTDNGTDYTSANDATSPAQGMSILNSAPINGKKMGYITITLKSTSSVSDASSFDMVSVNPNVITNGEFVVTNLGNTQINKVELITLSGASTVLANEPLAQNTLHLSANTSTAGIYLLRLTTANNNSIVRKIIIR